MQELPFLRDTTQTLLSKINHIVCYHRGLQHTATILTVCRGFWNRFWFLDLFSVC